jgi:prepilin-type processing-associated H-X9-DG protein
VTGAAATCFATQSLMTQLLPFIEQQDIYNAMDLTKSYRDITAGNKVPTSVDPINGTVTALDGVTAIKGNVWAATRNIATYVCPSNPFAAPQMRDPAGFGGTDYFATVYTDIDDGIAAGTTAATIGQRNQATRALGALTVDTTKLTLTGTGSSTVVTGDSTANTSVAISAISDGTSNTIAVIEDAGRVSPSSYTQHQAPYYCLSTYVDNMAPAAANMLPGDITGVGGAQSITGAAPTGQTARGVWRWADPDACGSGLSGPFGATSTVGPLPTQQVINQNASPIGGINPPLAVSGTTCASAQGTGCSWMQNNCGANDEPFSFHNGGCNCVMVDGSVRFLSTQLDPFTLRHLVTRAEGIPVDDTSVFQQ